MRNIKLAEKVIENLYKNNINLQPHEKVLVYTDQSEDRKKLINIANLFFDIAKNFSKHVSFAMYPTLKSHGSEPPEHIWVDAFGEAVIDELKRKGFFEKILNKEISDDKLQSVKKILYENRGAIVNVIIALSYLSTSHTIFRKLLTEHCNVRFCSMPLFEESMFYSALQEDWGLLKKRTLFLKEKLKNAAYVIVKSNNGTYLTFSVTNREFHVDTGDLSYPGAFSNIPAGEVFVAPLEGTTNGKIVIEYSHVSKLSSPLDLWIENGKVVNIDGSDPYKTELFRKFNISPDNRNVAEFGIGTNSRASNMFNILEAEKILGTIHIAFGDNSSFGGKVKTSFHEDYIVESPTVEVYTQNKENFFILYNGKPFF